MSKRQYADEQYLRAEHLLRGGKYIAPTLTISDVIYNCPGKKGDQDKIMLGLAFVETDKVLGLNRTNDNMICFVTGEGKPEGWVGKKVQLVVRLVPRIIERKKVYEPAIRVWSSTPHPRGQVRDQMGKEITPEWYAANAVKQEDKATEAAK